MTRDEIYQEFDRIMDHVESTANSEGYDGFLRVVNELERVWNQELRTRGEVTDLDAVRAAIAWALKNEGLHDDFDNHELAAFVEGFRWAKEALGSSNG